MRRREFIAVLSGAAAWPVVAGAQQAGTKHIGAFMSTALKETFSDGYRQGVIRLPTRRYHKSQNNRDVSVDP